MAALTPLQAVKSTRFDDPFLHASLDVTTAIRYAESRASTCGRMILMLDRSAIARTFGAQRVIDLSSSQSRTWHVVDADAAAAAFASRDFEVLLHVPYLSVGDGHVHLAYATEQLGLSSSLASSDD
eukprot:5110999-Prymnesium_polylepis.1